MFAFNWPQPPEVTAVIARPIGGEETISKTKVCVRCGAKIEATFTECPKCGVILDKAKKQKVIDPVAKGATPELAAAWDQVKTNYGEENRHEAFIQLCLSRENLAYASSQYRSVLDANPSDDIANRMQNRIIELATLTYVTTHKEGAQGGPY